MSAEQPEIDIDYVAHLARLSLSEAEKTRIGEQLEQILEHFQKLNEVDLDGVEPMAHAAVVENVWQQDEPEPGFTPEAALCNAPAQRENQIVVPKVVGDA